ncbi:MAG: hypothetical protein AB8B74_11110 [Crocinitomicaceae bacterium]
MEGSYRIKSNHLSDSFDIVFDVDYAPLGYETFNNRNYDGLGSDCINQAEISGANYRQVWTIVGTSVQQCDYLKGSIHNRIEGVTEMKFSFGASSSTNPNYNERIYLGRRL